MFFHPRFVSQTRATVMQSDSNYYTNGVTVLFFGNFPIEHIKIVF